MLGYAAALWLLVSTGATLYYLVCFAAPQLTSQGYKDLAAGVIQVPPIVMGCPGPEGLSPEEENSRIKECLDATRRGALSDELQKERRRGVHGVLVWGSMLDSQHDTMWRKLASPAPRAKTCCGLTTLERAVNGWWLRAAGAGRQCAPAALLGRFWAAVQLHR